MKINNILLSTFGATLIDRIIEPINITSELEWPLGATDGIIVQDKQEWKSIKLTLLVEGITEDDAYKKISVLSNELKQSIIEFNDIELVFNCVLVESSTQRIGNGAFKVYYTLKNDTAETKTLQTVSVDITPVAAQKIVVKYYDNYVTNMGHYDMCWPQEEKCVLLGEQSYYIDKTSLNNKASGVSSWDALALALGINLNQFKPAANNTYNGRWNNTVTYSASAAVAYFNTSSEISVLYDRFHKDGISDFPASNFPEEIMFSSGLVSGEAYYFIINIPQEYQNAAKLSYRLFAAPSADYSSGTNTVPLGGNFSLSHTNNDGYSGTTPFGYTVKKPFDDDETFAIPVIKEYSITLDNFSNHTGYFTTVYNSKVVNRYYGVSDNDTISTLVIFSNGTGAYGKVLFSKIEIYYDNELIASYIPIGEDTHIPNGFYNDYGYGLYDTVSMKWLSANTASGTILPAPYSFMPWPEEV